MRGRGLIILGAGIAGLLFLVAGVAIGRAQSARPTAARRSEARAERPHGHGPGCAHVPEAFDAKPEPTHAERAEAAEKLHALAAAPDRSRRLNDLQELLALQLADGRTSAIQVLDLIRAERDPAVLEVYIGALQQNPDASNAPETVRAFQQMADADAAPERRRAALQFLAGAWDRDGAVRGTLLRLAKDEPDPAVRHSALASLKEYGVKNHEAAAAVNGELLAIARGASADDFRAQAILSLALRDADEAGVRDVASLLQDRSIDVRLSAADALGDVRAEHRAAAVQQLDAAIAREGDAAARAAMMLSLVRAGRADAAAALERVAERDPVLRQDALDYAQILKSGEQDLARIMDEKQRLEAKRAK